jgi:hypothetical protein
VWTHAVGASGGGEEGGNVDCIEWAGVSLLAE